MSKTSAVFLNSAVAGSFGSLLTHPLDTLRVRMQTTAVPVRIPTTAGAQATAVLGVHGWQGLFQGVTAPVLFHGARTACIFFGYEKCLYVLGGKDSLSSHLLAGAVGGVLASPITSPVELVKCRAQVSSQLSTSNVARQILSRDGLRGFACGYPLTASRDALYRSVYFATIELVRRTAGPGENGDQFNARKKLVTFVGGGTAGVVSWIAAYPLDVMKTNWQTGQRFGAKTITEMFHRGLALHGSKWLYRGFPMTVLRAWSMNAVVVSLYEGLRPIP